MVFTCRHILYRIYDIDQVLLYVGITDDLRRRMSDHARDKPWWHEVAGCRVEFYSTRVLLEQAELIAIATENPKHNIRGVPRPETTQRQLVASGAKRGGGPSVYVPVRVPTDLYDEVLSRALAETGGNMSSTVRAMIDWGSTRMPKGWNE